MLDVDQRTVLLLNFRSSIQLDSISRMNVVILHDASILSSLNKMMKHWSQHLYERSHDYFALKVLGTSDTTEDLLVVCCFTELPPFRLTSVSAVLHSERYKEHPAGRPADGEPLPSNAV